MMMMNKIGAFARLARISSPSVYSVYFFPASFGLLLSSSIESTYFFLMLFFIGSVIVRSAGCIVNDIADREFDRLVERTKSRPLASGELSLNEALLALVVLSFISLFILLSLPRVAISIGVVAAVMTGLYPLMKRITYLPQLFLGFTINAGVLIGYATMHNNLSIEALIMYLACCFWTLGYDTIYAFMDLKDDKKVGIKGTAVLLEDKNYHLWLIFFYLSFVALFSFALYYARGAISYLQLFGIALAAGLMIWQVATLDITSASSCSVRFRLNNYVGMILLASCIA